MDDNYVGNVYIDEGTPSDPFSYCGANVCFGFTGPFCNMNACIDHTAYCQNNWCYQDDSIDRD